MKYTIISMNGNYAVHGEYLTIEAAKIYGVY